MAENSLSLDEARGLAETPKPKAPVKAENAVSLKDARRLTADTSDADRALGVIKRAFTTPKGISETIQGSATWGLSQGVRAFLINTVGSPRQREQLQFEQEEARKAEKDKKSFVEGLKETPKALAEVGKSFVKAPLTTTATILTQLMPDTPLFGLMGEAGVPARVARVAKTLSGAEKESKLVIAGAGVAEGAAVGAGTEAAKQYGEKGKITSPGEVSSSAAQWAAFDAGARVLGMLRGKKIEEKPKGEEEPKEFVNVPGGPLAKPGKERPKSFTFMGRENVPTSHENIEARALFKDDAEYGDYLQLESSQKGEAHTKAPMEEAVGDTHRATESARADINTAMTVKTAPWDEVKAALEKDPAHRSAAEREMLKKWQLGTAMSVAGGATLAYALADDQTQRKMAAAGFTLAAPFAIPEGGRALGPLLQKASYGSRVLERLPKNRMEFKKEHVQQEINRPDVSKAEKETLQKILDAHKGENIGASELMKAFGQETGRFELVAQNTGMYSDYGLENIRPPSMRMGEFPQIPDDDIKSTVYRLPKEWAIPAVGHFSEMGGNQFGHTRSFREDGVTHVIEMQSDLLQHQKDLPAGVKERLRAEKEAMEDNLHGILEKQEHLREAINRVGDDPMDAGAYRDLLKDERYVKLRIAEIDARLKRGETSKELAPIAKAWWRRLVQEELARAGARGEGKVLFASADTVAKVEMWPQKADKWPDDALEAVKAGREGNFPEIAGRRFMYDGEEVELTGKLHRVPIGNTGRRFYGFEYKRFGGDKVISTIGPDLAIAAARSPGAPKGEFLEKGHQDIYDRYKDEVTKYLKSLGGKEVTDAQGHTWFSVVTPGGPPRMFGHAQPALLAMVAGAGLGYAIGAQDKESPIRSELIGIALGALGGRILGKAAEGFKPKMEDVGKMARGAAETLKPGKAKDIARGMAEKIPGGEKAPKGKERVRIKDAIDNHQHRIAATARQVMQVLDKIMKAVPDAARREVLTRALDGEMVALTKSEREAFETLKGEFKKIGDEAIKLGILDELRENYVTHLIKRGQEDKLAAFLKQIRTPTMSPRSPYAKARMFPTIKELEAAGLELASKDAATIYSRYAFGMNRTIANKELLNGLLNDVRNVVIPAGRGRVPANYKTVDRPILMGMKVHPDIVPELSFLFDTRDPDAWVKAVSALSTTAKRAEVSFSLFHAMSLTQAYAGVQGKVRYAAVGAAVGAGAAVATGQDPYVGGLAGTAIGMVAPIARDISGFVSGKNKYLKQLHEGGPGDEVDKALRAGLKLSMERSGPVVTDVAQDFYSGMEGLQGLADKYVHPIAGKGVEQVVKANHFVDNVMWGRLHAGMKLQVYMDKKAKLLKESAERHDRIPESPMLSDERAGEIAASFANSLFGGLNWTKLMEGVNAKVGREVAAALTSPTGMRYLNILTFAPDWTVSTTMSAIRALDLRPSQAELSSLHRQYMVRAALYTFAAAEALNYSLSGKHLWDEDDWTVVHLGDGSTMQLSKHFFEPFEWYRKGGQEALNKLGAVPSEAGEQLMGKQYLSTKGAPELKGAGERVKHAAARFLPFGGQQITRGNIKGAIWGTLGLPIYPPKKSGKKKKSSDYLEESLD